MKYKDYRNIGFTTLPNGLIAYYSQIGITDAQMLLILQLEAFAQRDELFPANDKIAANTNFSANEVAALIQQLIDQKDLIIEQTTDSQGKIGNRYNLDNLYDKLEQYLDSHILVKSKKNNEPAKVADDLENNPLNRLSRQFEVEFGRYLSPIEREEIASWLSADHYKPEIIELALREAVLSQAYSLKYVDRILLNWQRHNLKTSTEIKNFLQRNR
ncbi:MULTISPECIES: DnaD domain protein [Lactobacillus]|uniref:DnaD domain protein n=1 Tax=Lactobacillus xujianguonis TaxID=2495899 RepID=A0A437SXS8_9LACO|nr:MULTISPECIES: DnaD domain protein [Lactobacillus]RVU71732.1 DnaD domain protein [Lactobacillus xujianguonis]RVU77562.1 DnaD domain protein [Lactobacillus xujianguonis]